ncbi:MAG: ChbG/HpnK family deacetylase, partial [Bacteroidales bacterium]|nr:ChbG/HpnK family deacetylase [Bacteroidales bacterium]
MKIIVCADDFGRSQERNKAIDEAFRLGLIKSAGLLVNAKYTQEAVDLALAGGYIQHLHPHFNIVSGDLSGFSHPLSKKMLKNKAFCNNGDFRRHDRASRGSYANIFLSSVVFDELEQQYLLFQKLTDGKGNDKHIDFHLWNNYRFPVSIAISRLIKKYNILSYRRQGLQHNRGAKKIFRIFSSRLCSNANCIMNIPSSCVDWFLHTKEQYSDDVIEAYVHPDYIDGVLMDNTCPVYSKKRFPINDHIDKLKEAYGSDIISWIEV